MKTKKIINSKEKQIHIADIIMFLVCFMIANMITKFKTGITFGEYIFSYTKILIELHSNLVTWIVLYISIFWMVIMNIIMRCFFIIVIYIAFRNARKKVINDNKKYEVIDNIEYYRERFNDITPTEISLIADLEIEAKKDITASIIDLYQKKIIEFNNKKLIIKNGINTNLLRKSEIKLLEMLKENNFKNTEVQEWKNICIKEAIEDNFIEERSNNIDYKMSKYVSKIAIIIFLISIIIGILMLGTDSMKKFEENSEILEKYETDEDYSELKLAINNYEYAKLYVETISMIGPFVLVVIGLTFSVVVLIAMPIYRKSRGKFDNSMVGNKYQRTKEGKILVEQIAGIQQYIHDFSLLSEKDKECVNIWEDFLIYAIVLEENKRIIDDIGRYKNINNITVKFSEFFNM